MRSIFLFFLLRRYLTFGGSLVDMDPEDVKLLVYPQFRDSILRQFDVIVLSSEICVGVDSLYDL